MTSINARSPSSTASTTNTASTSKTTQTSAPPPPADDHAEALPSSSTSAAPSTRKASAEELAAAKSAAANVKDEASAEDAALKLIRLPNADFAAAIKDVAAEPGRLEQLLAKVPESTKESIQRRLVGSGVLQPAVGAPSTPTSPKAPQPPKAPVIFKDDPSLPPSLRQLAVDENVAKLGPWKEEMKAYREAYGAAVDNAKSVAELRALGPMHEPTAPTAMPSTSGAVSGPYNEQYQEARGENVDDDNMMTRVADKARELSGVPIGGKFTFKLTGEAMVTLGGASSFGLEGGVERDTAGKTEGGVAVHAGAGPVSGAVDDEGKLSGGADIGPISVGLSDDGLELGADLGLVSTTATYNGDHISYGAKVGGKVEIGDVELEASIKGEVGLQGVTKLDRDGFVSTSDVGFFTKPSPELLKTPWAKLPADVKKAFENQLWTEAEWSKARDLAAPLKR